MNLLNCFNINGDSYYELSHGEGQAYEIATLSLENSINDIYLQFQLLYPFTYICMCMFLTQIF